jgi:hypothetical protein
MPIAGSHSIHGNHSATKGEMRMATRSKMKEPDGEQATPSTFQGLIVKAMGLVTNDLLSKIKQDTGSGANVSRTLAELFMWNWIRKYADGRYDKLLASAREDGMLGDLDNKDPGSYLAAESRHFVMTVSISEPVRRFDPDVLGEWAFATYKVPVIVLKEQIEKARTPTKSQVRVTVTER